MAKDTKADRADDRINIGSGRPVEFYVELVKKIMANPEKPDELEITGLASCITAVVSVADSLREQGLATIKKMETGVSGRGDKTAKMQIWVKKGPDFDTNFAKLQAEKEERLKARIATSKNSAFVFIKPHAVTEEVKKLVADTLEAKGIKILRKGELKSEVIDKKKLIDQHYYAIASKATILKPNELNVPADKFKEKFGLGWEEALEKGVVYNAMDACKKLDLTAEQLDAEWAKCKKAGKLVKFGGGFYCGLVEVDGKDPIYVFNGFFMQMRTKFTQKGLSIYWFTVEWDSKDLSWADFRGKVLGPTDPAEAPADSLRGIVMKDWEKLGLKKKPDVGDNGVHASASPFEGLAERMNWLQGRVEKDGFGKTLLSAGVPMSMIKNWSKDPQVTLLDGSKGSIFDALEDIDAPECIEKCVALAKQQPQESS